LSKFDENVKDDYKLKILIENFSNSNFLLRLYKQYLNEIEWLR